MTNCQILNSRFGLNSSTKARYKNVMAAEVATKKRLCYLTSILVQALELSLNGSQESYRINLMPILGLVSKTKDFNQ